MELLPILSQLIFSNDLACFRIHHLKNIGNALKRRMLAANTDFNDNFDWFAIVALGSILKKCLRLLTCAQIHDALICHLRLRSTKYP